MSKGPHLQQGEAIVHHHKPDMGAFKRAALVSLAITLVPTGVMISAVPDTIWVAVPLFITCLLLMQERFTLGKYAAWVTNRRVILQDGATHRLADIHTVDTIANAVRLRHNRKRTKLYYPKDKAGLKDIIDTARREDAP